MSRLRVGIAIGVLAALMVGIVGASSAEARGGPGGNSANARLCQQEWQTLRTSDGESFKNVGKCVSYAAKGGEFAAPDPHADKRAFCEDVLGGTLQFEERNGVTVWLCVGVTGELPPEDQVDYDLFCAGNITTEFRSGEMAVVCTPRT